MEDRSCSPSSSTPAPAVFQALNEQEGTKIPSPIVNSSLSRSDESTIVFGGDLSLTTCRGSAEDLAEAETVLQTPNRPEEEEEKNSSDMEFERIEENIKPPQLWHTEPGHTTMKNKKILKRY